MVDSASFDLVLQVLVSAEIAAMLDDLAVRVEVKNSKNNFKFNLILMKDFRLTGKNPGAIGPPGISFPAGN